MNTLISNAAAETLNKAGHGIAALVDDLKAEGLDFELRYNARVEQIREAVENVEKSLRTARDEQADEDYRVGEAISTISSLYPPGDGDNPWADTARETLHDAVGDNWRELPSHILTRLAAIQQDRDNA